MRESIFTAALRAFFRAIFVVVGVGIGIFVVGFAVSMVSNQPYTLPTQYQVTILPNAAGNRQIKSQTTPVLLHIPIDGVIGLRDLTHTSIENILLSSQEGILEGRVKGILLHINSPGGSASDSDEIYRALARYKKKYTIPIHAYIDGMCASGGMYIACSADYISSTPSGIIGSVGVRLGPVLNYTGLMEKVGVNALTLTQGLYKDMLNPTKPFDTKNYQCLQDMIVSDYARFLSVVSSARPKLTEDMLRNTLGAQVYDPEKALEYGYIDSASSDYYTAVEALAKAANLSDYEVVQIAFQRPMLRDLLEENRFLRGEVVHTLSLPEQLDPKLWNRVLYLYQVD